ncbi:MAG: hemolysin III family protein [Nibricoccus sp.]
MTAPAAYTNGEEIANSITHGIGVLLSVAALALLVTIAVSHGDAWSVTSGAIYGSTLIIAYTASTIYHSLRSERAKRFFRKLDHAGIFLLIAGTYTPFLLVSLRGPWGWSLFGVIWGLCVAGIIMKFFLAGRFRVISTLIYIFMGWMIAIAFRPLLSALPAAGVWLLVAGGICYTGGTVFYLWKSLRYHHAIWHLFVLAGSICHFFSVLNYVMPAGS